MLCIGPVCVPVWQLGVVGALILGPLRCALDTIYEKLCGRRRREPHTDATASAASQMSPPEGLRRRNLCGMAGVQHVHSDEDVKKLWEKFENAKDCAAPVFVDFSAEWCQPCKSIYPFYKNLSEKYDGLFLKIDVDECPDIASALDVRVLPTLCCMKFVGGDGGRVCARTTGANQGDWETLVAAHALRRFACNAG